MTLFMNFFFVMGIIVILLFMMPHVPSTVKKTSSVVKKTGEKIGEVRETISNLQASRRRR
ncbi:MAG: hypothetical protein EAZ55_07635 [Cytophagales bacterium]|nr:MAG: hypothetical protein EAZ55_07635 [Cytophagales bacterium]